MLVGIGMPTYGIDMTNKKSHPGLRDLICYDQIIVEIKAVKEVAAEHKAQVINYLKASGMKLGLVVSFGSYPKATITRLAL